MLDTLEIAKRLKSVGFDESQAETLTGILRDQRDADLSRLATKEDIAATRAEIATIRTEIGAAEARLESKIELLRRDLVIRLGAMIAVAIAILSAVIKL